MVGNAGQLPRCTDYWVPGSTELFLGDLGMKRHRLHLSTLGGQGEEELRWDPALFRAPLQVTDRTLPQGYPLKRRKKGLLPAVPKQGWAGEGELKARSCSLSLSQSDVKAEDPEYNAPAEAAELCR